MRSDVLAAVLVSCGVLAACDGARVSALELRETTGTRTIPKDVPPPRNTTTELLFHGAFAPRGVEGLRALVAARDAVDDGLFDGAVLDLGAGSLASDELDASDLGPAVAAVRDAGFTRLRANVQDMRVGGIDFADDAGWARLSRNVGVLAAASKQAGLRGVFFDVQVGPSAWRWSSGTFDAAEALAKGRGVEVGRALFGAFPEAHVLTSLAYSAVFVDTCFGGAALEQQELALLPAFLDGMAAAQAELRTPSRIVDAFLLGYPTRDPLALRLYGDLVRFDWTAAEDHWIPGVVTYRFAYDAPSQAAGERRWPDRPTRSCDAPTRARLERDLALGFGIAVDHRAWERGALGPEPANEYRDPETLERVVRTALATADGYVWLWSGQPFWPAPGASEPPMPARFVEAVRRARSSP